MGEQSALELHRNSEQERPGKPGPEHTVDRTRCIRAEVGVPSAIELAALGIQRDNVALAYLEVEIVDAGVKA